MNTDNQKMYELYQAILLLKTEDEVARFLKDLCTPQEVSDLADRWQVCRLLHEGNLSYREIQQKTGVSLATITRVARFLKDEPHQGYATILQRMKQQKSHA